MMGMQSYNNEMSRVLRGVLTMFVMMVVLTPFLVIAAKPQGQKSFHSPQEAAVALVAAVKETGDGELLAILGPGSEPLISSGDMIADRNGRMRFIKAFEKKNSLETEGENRTILIVGQKDYPFPIPIVKKGSTWIFDTAAGADEILNRRIGRNELRTIEVMRAYTDAQREFACMKRDGCGTEFAQKFASSEGKKDGLYWEAKDGEKESPFGPLIARAVEEGYPTGPGGGPPEPFHGYYFKILTEQGPHADGGAFSYLADGKMVLGFALVAYPASYGVSGIMTFIVNQEGTIYEKDLGEKTPIEAAAITAYDPDDSWHRYGDAGNEPM